MPTYNSIEEFENQALIPEITRILNDIAIEIQQFLRVKILEEIYNSYTPKVYERSEQLLNSAQIKPIVKDANNFYIEVYIPEDVYHSVASIYDHPDIGITKGSNPTLSQVMQVFEMGYGYGRGGQSLDPVGDTANEYIEQGKALKFIISKLKKKFDVIA